MKVLVAGGGVGGLVTALCLHQAGIQVQVFERAGTPGETGAGIQISPNGSRVLHALGLEEALAQVAFLPESIVLRLADSGREILTSPLGQHSRDRYGFPYYHLHRGDLYKLLMDAVVARCGENSILSGQEVTEFSEQPGCIGIRTSAGLEDEGDFLVGADGVHSTIRARMGIGEEATFTGHVAWRGVVPASQLQSLQLAPVVTSWMSPHSHAVTYLLRRGELVNFVAIKEQRSWQEESWTTAGTNAELMRDVSDWHPDLQAIAEHISTPYRWALFERKPLPSWTSGRVALLGDACHAMLPYVAQGAVMAIEDASVLARCLNDLPLTEAAGRYQSLRLARTARVQSLAARHGRLFHVANPLMRMLTYGAMTLGGRLIPEYLDWRVDWLMSYDALTDVGL